MGRDSLIASRLVGHDRKGARPGNLEDGGISVPSEDEEGEGGAPLELTDLANQGAQQLLGRAVPSGFRMVRRLITVIKMQIRDHRAS